MQLLDDQWLRLRHDNNTELTESDYVHFTEYVGKLLNDIDNPNLFETEDARDRAYAELFINSGNNA